MRTFLALAFHLAAAIVCLYCAFAVLAGYATTDAPAVTYIRAGLALAYVYGAGCAAMLADRLLTEHARERRTR